MSLQIFSLNSLTIYQNPNMRAENVKQYAKYMRINPTPAEFMFWLQVKKRSFFGLRFNRQKIFNYVEHTGVMRFYIVDFYCHELKIAVEIDGGYHENPYQIELDEFRTETLVLLGLNIIRFKNEDVINNWDNLSETFLAQIKVIEEKKLRMG